MSYDVSNLELIWRKGDGDMPDDLKHVIQAAKDERLLRSLQLPSSVIDTIRYNASKCDKTVDEYISSLVLEVLNPVKSTS